jgi:MYXO-CTERM domain-containing protein
VANLLTVLDANTTRLGDSAVFAPTGKVSVVKDISVNGNSGGFATISEVVDTFSQTTPVAEPTSLGLLGFGMLGLGLVTARRRR